MTSQQFKGDTITSGYAYCLNYHHELHKKKCKCYLTLQQLETIMHVSTVL